MKKLWITILFPIIIGGLYVAMMMFTLDHYRLGNFALLCGDVIVFITGYWVLWRLHAVHNWFSEAARGHTTLKLLVVCIIMGFNHLMGIFLPLEFALWCAFLPPIALVNLWAIKWMMENKMDRIV